MDDFLNDVKALADIARRRKTPWYDAEAIMLSVSGLSPDPVPEEYGFGLFAAFTASSAAAAVIVFSYASAAWNELKNPFLALDSLTNVLDWL
jgi:hypothetical protein